MNSNLETTKCIYLHRWMILTLSTTNTVERLRVGELKREPWCSDVK